MADVVVFGEDTKVPEGFEICDGCGVAVEPGKTRADVKHRRSCPGRRQTETMQREGRPGNAFHWQQAWLYRELRSEAIRLLLPDVEEEDLDTLEACIYLGLRLRFQGDPAHLMVRPQQVPDFQAGVTRHYLVLMDAVPGGTGFLKTLYQETDEQGRAGEGVLDMLRRARIRWRPVSAVSFIIPRMTPMAATAVSEPTTCSTGQRISAESEASGCSRILSLPVRSAPCERRLDEIKALSLFGSVLEKRFVERLRDWVEKLGGQWQETLINGSQGFRFVLGDPERSWELELQPLLGPANGVSVACQPDFMLRCDDPSVKPIAIFTDGFDAHVHPNEPELAASR